ncbi:MAG: BlaI/MecI/CopY family transcriptional regulator [Candidatus Latescibacteria bacterium]|nr:BlaI/MecI/CopY family transcriptional regulator [Candidatus Latescibacterota bacterium]
MPRKKSPTFTEVELEFMQIIWSMGEVTTVDMQNALREKGRNLSDGSIRKILSILMEKGHLERERNGRSFIYRAIVQKDQAHKRILQDILNRVFGGSISMMATALFDIRYIAKDDIEKIRKLIDDHKSE